MHVKVDAAHLLASEYHDQRVIDYLEDWLQKKNWKLRKGAIYVLMDIADERAVQLIEEHLQDGKSRVRRAALHALSTIRYRNKH